MYGCAQVKATNAYKAEFEVKVGLQIEVCVKGV